MFDVRDAITRLRATLSDLRLSPPDVAVLLTPPPLMRYAYDSACEAFMRRCCHTSRH